MRAVLGKGFRMKKLVAFGCFLLLMATNSLYAQSVNIDTAILNSAAYFERQLQKNITIAVTNITSDSFALSEYIINGLSSYFVNGGNFTVVDRTNLDIVQQEINYQLSGEVNDETAQSIGRKIGAQTIITGSIRLFGNEYLLTIRALSVETGAIQGSTQSIINDNRLTAFLGGGTNLFEWSYDLWNGGINLNYQNQSSSTRFGLKDSMQKALALYEDTNKKFLSYKKKTLFGNIFSGAGYAAFIASPLVLFFGDYSSTKASIVTMNTVLGLFGGGIVSTLTGSLIFSLGQENLFDAVNSYNRYQLTGYRNNAPVQR